MAHFPSLSLWSSIKIPFSLYGKQKITPTVPYVDSCKDLKQTNYKGEAEPARELVNLRVPTPFSKREESSDSASHLHELLINHKKRIHRRYSSEPRAKQIGYVVVPNEISLDKSDDSEETFGNNNEKGIANSRRSKETSMDDDFHNCPEFDFEGVCGECDYVPSVKPWVQEELDEINRKYKLVGHKTLKMIKDKKQNKEKENTLTHNKRTNKTRENLNGKEFKMLQIPFYKDLKKTPNKQLQKLVAKVKATSADADYYERKLAELYVIELGLKSK